MVLIWVEALMVESGSIALTVTRKQQLGAGDMKRLISPHSFTIVDRNIVWTSIHGVKTKIVDMDDAYLANLYDYLKRRVEKSYGHKEFNEKLMEVIKELQEERGLKNEFMGRAQIPYKNPHDRWEIWDFNRGHPIELQEATA
jgi:hypothetical protein